MGIWTFGSMPRKINGAVITTAQLVGAPLAQVNHYPHYCFTSSWYGEWTTQCGFSNCGDMVLEQDGVNVNGTYAGGSATVEGTVDGSVFTGTYTRGGGSGDFTFFLQPGGKRFLRQLGWFK